MIKLFTPIFLILFFNIVDARDVYVDASSNGSDITGDGTLAKPYKTIQKAADLAVAGDTIYIRQGTYRETVAPPRSGTAGSPIVFTAYQNEEVIISGANVISGWTLEQSHPSRKVWKAPMNSTRNIPDIRKDEAGRDQVFIDGAMQVEARWPNIIVNPATVDRSTYTTAVTAALQGTYTTNGETATVKYTGSQLPPVNLTNAYIHFFPGFFWWPATGKITSNSGNELIFNYIYKTGIYYAPRAGDIYYLWGKYELLDAPGEWFRKPDGMLYLYTPLGDSPDNHVVEVKVRDDVFNLHAKAYITIKNIKIRAGRIRTNSQSNNVIIDGIDAKYTAHYSIVPDWWSINGVGAIGLGGASSVVTNSNIAYTVEGGIALGGNNSRAYNNVVHDTGYLGTAGTLLSCTGDQMELKNNTVWGTGGANAIDFRFATRSKIWYNDAAESGKGTFDGGILMGARKRAPNIDFDGQNTEVAYNYIHDGKGLNDGSRGFYGTSGIYFEGDLENYLVHHNVIWNTGVGINIPNGNDEHNRNFKIYNNTVYDHALVMRSGDMTGTELKNNIFTRFIQAFNRDFSIENNLLTTTEINYGTNIPASNRYATQPGFTDAVNRNFVPAAGSPMIDAGLVQSPFTNGFLGSAPDIGAFENGKPAFIGGALVRSQDVTNITIAYDNTPFPNKRFTVSGLPAGRKIASNSKLKIGMAESGGTMEYNHATNQISFINVPKGNLTGRQPISLDMGTEGVHATNSTIDLSALSIYNIVVYPNPSKGDFFIKIPAEYQDKEVRIQVYALDGKIILDKNMKDRTDAIKLNTKGIYILKTTIENQVFANKIFIQ